MVARKSQSNTQTDATQGAPTVVKAKRVARRSSKAIARADYLMSERVKAKAPRESVVTANQMAASYGVSGKYFRGRLRASTLVGNDMVYTRYGFDTRKASFKALVDWANATFGAPSAARIRSAPKSK